MPDDVDIVRAMEQVKGERLIQIFLMVHLLQKYIFYLMINCDIDIHFHKDIIVTTYLDDSNIHLEDF